MILAGARNVPTNFVVKNQHAERLSNAQKEFSKGKGKGKARVCYRRSQAAWRRVCKKRAKNLDLTTLYKFEKIGE